MAGSRGPFDEVDVSACRSQRLLTLKPAALTRLQSLQEDSKIAALSGQLGTAPAIDKALLPTATAVAVAAAAAAGTRRTALAPPPPSGSAAATTTSRRLDPTDIVGKKVKKHFPGHGYFTGTITAYDPDVQWYTIVYSDNTVEDVSAKKEYSISI